MRRFLRHPSNLPVELQVRKRAFIPWQRLNDISLGGVACHSQRAFRRGMSVHLHIPLLGEQTRYPGLVAWCRKQADGYLIGVAFTGHDPIARSQMVERICQLEQYRQVREREAGKPLSIELIAQEWLEQRSSSITLASG